VDTGQYELFIYRLDAWNGNDVGDALDGRGGNDLLKGGLGNDALTGGAGNDTMHGGAGNDKYVATPSGADVVVETTGRDALDFSAAALGVTFNLGLASGQVQVIDTVGNTLAITGSIETVFGTPFTDTFTGNDADNVILGGAGNDVLQGGDGRDLLIGGLGTDLLQGQAGDDILIGSVTTFDSSQASLDSIMAEWSSADTYAQRVAHLTGTAGGANGSTYLIKGTTVLNDANAKDTLQGGLGADLFFTFSGDKVDDKENGETVV
jgi:Ca2+-binding RTX toxin-like protein